MKRRSDAWLVVVMLLGVAILLLAAWAAAGGK